MASSVESSFDVDSGTVNMTTLTRNLEQSLACQGCEEPEPDCVKDPGEHMDGKS